MTGCLRMRLTMTTAARAVFKDWWTRAMRRGLAIFLDVVYNHFGPEGNILEAFGPYMTDRYKTPWGAAVNYDRAGCDAVRDFVLENVRMWLEEFHFDGLRLDAADTIFDLGARHIWVQSRRLRTMPAVGGVGRRS